MRYEIRPKPHLGLLVVSIFVVGVCNYLRGIMLSMSCPIDPSNPFTSLIRIIWDHSQIKGHFQCVQTVFALHLHLKSGFSSFLSLTVRLLCVDTNSFCVLFQPAEDVSVVSWNRQVQHILASANPSGKAVVWDLRKNEPIIKISDHSNRVGGFKTNYNKSRLAFCRIGRYSQALSVLTHLALTHV